MSTKNDMAASVGRDLGLTLSQSLTPAAAPSLRYATVTRIYESGGQILSDLTINGGTLTAVPVTSTCTGAMPGDRVIVETYAHLSTVTGVLARMGRRTALLWKSTWTGTPSAGLFTEVSRTVWLGERTLVELAACVQGTGQYVMNVVCKQAGTVRASMSLVTPRAANGSRYKYATCGLLTVSPGEYEVTLTTARNGELTIEAANTTLSQAWRDGELGTDGVNRYCRLTRL